MSSLPPLEMQERIRKALAKLAPEERRQALAVVSDKLSGTGSLYDAYWRADFDTAPPSIAEFLDSDDYMGRVTRPSGKADGLYEAWRKELLHVCDPANHIYEWIIHGCIGSGKTTAALLAILYKICYTLHLRSPATYYGLMEGTPIIFAFFSIFKYLAEDVGFKKFQIMMRRSPFFSKMGDTNRDGDVVAFADKNVYFALGGEAVHAIGLDVLGGLLDEANFGRDRGRISTTQSQMHSLYTETMDRIASRYLQGGQVGQNPGLLIAVSSERDKSDFLTKHMGEVVSNPCVHVSRYAIWEVKPKLQTGKWFWVFAGDEGRDPRVLSGQPEAEEMMDSGRVIAVPESPYFRERFSHDIAGAIRNQAGVETHGSGKFLANRELYWKCLRSSTVRPHPFESTEILLGLKSGETLVDSLRRRDLLVLVDKRTDRWRPKWHPGVPRAVHVDLAKKKDAAGIAMACLPDRVRVAHHDLEGHLYHTYSMRVWIDFMLRIKAKPGSEIDFAKIRQLIYFLQANGFPIAIVTYDQYQSTESIQMLTKADIESRELSVDKTRRPYDLLRAVIYEQRFDHYDYEPLRTELFDLDDSGKKIDHPEGGSKDVSDAAAGAVWNLISAKKDLIGESGLSDRVPEGVFPMPDPVAIDRDEVEFQRVTRDVLAEAPPLDKLFDEDERK